MPWGWKVASFMAGCHCQATDTVPRDAGRVNFRVERPITRAESPWLSPALPFALDNRIAQESTWL
jgi:hypothetical protein